MIQFPVYKFNYKKVLIRKHRQFITLFASLVILLAQFGVVVHASEHSFHQEETLCFSFQNVGQDKLFLNAISVASTNNILVDSVVVSLRESSLSSFNSNYSSRAPPVITL